MKLMNPRAPVMASWLYEFGRRLDAGPFLSGAIESRKILEDLSVRKDPLCELTAGGMAGIIHAGRIPRIWVDDPDHGLPFLSSTDILQADLSKLSLISKRIVEANPKLVIRRGWTLITRSGTIGKTAFARPEMDGMACTEDVLRVVPAEQTIPGGYLYAFLSSRFGLPIITASTYGSIIQHLEPHHLANLPVPRFGKKLEQQVHDLVQEAANARSQAATEIRDAAKWFDDTIVGIDRKRNCPRISLIPATQIQVRMDAAFHDPLVESIRHSIRQKEHVLLVELCERIFLPGIFKRIHIEDETFGVPYFTGSSLYRLEPEAKGILSRKTTLFDDVQLKEGTILVQAFGQEGGLTGRPVWVGRFLDGKTTTHMLARIFTRSQEVAGYLFAFLSSNVGYQQVRVLPFGGSIPHFSEQGLGAVVVPMLESDVRRKISRTVLTALAARDDALEMEQRARTIVESAIEGDS